VGDFEAASTAAEGRFNSKRQAVFFRELDDLLGIIDWISGARDEWRTNFLGDVAGPDPFAPAPPRSRSRRRTELGMWPVASGPIPSR